MLPQMMGSVPLVQPMDLSRWHSPTSSQVKVSHARYRNDPDDSSPAPLPQTPELATHPSPYQDASGRTFAYHPSPKWSHTSPFAPLTYKSDPSTTGGDPYHPRLPSVYGYPCDQPWALVEEDKVAAVQRKPKNEPKHVCLDCGKAFNRPSSLTTHTAVHTGDKRSAYTCREPDCGKRFSVSSNLKRHQRTHITRRNAPHTIPELVDASQYIYHPSPHQYETYPIAYGYPTQPPPLEYSGSSSMSPSNGSGLGQYQFTRKRRRVGDSYGPVTPQSSVRVLSGYPEDVKDQAEDLW